MNPELVRIVRRERELREKYPDNPFMWAWDPTEVKVDNYRVNKLMREGVVVKTMYNKYRLSNFEDYDKQLREIEEAHDHNGKEEGETDEIKEIFGLILGLDDIKRLLLRSINAVGHHILFVGPPATAKSLLLMSLENLKGAYKFHGETTTKAGLKDILVQNDVRYLIIDELEKMKVEDLTVLLNAMESQKIIVSQHGKRVEKTLNMNVYAAVNRLDLIQRKIPELQSRFMVIRLKEYTLDELRQVYVHMLKVQEGFDDDLALFTANELIKNGFRDPRDARKIARIAKTKEEIRDTIQIYKKYALNNL